MKNEKDY